jgi:hypothetical protein
MRQYQTGGDEKHDQQETDQRRAARIRGGLRPPIPGVPLVWIFHRVFYTPRILQRSPGGLIEVVARFVNQLSPRAWCLRHDFRRLKIDILRLVRPQAVRDPPVAGSIGKIQERGPGRKREDSMNLTLGTALQAWRAGNWTARISRPELHQESSE